MSPTLNGLSAKLEWPSGYLKRPFDIDNYLNPYIPGSPLHLVPKRISYWFGYRAPRSKDSPPPKYHHVHTLILYTSILVGAFCGVALIEGVFLSLPLLSGHEVPLIIASFGAAAILEYNTIESPLAQPRNLVVGHFLAALVAVGITKLFELLPGSQFNELRWLAGALAVGASSLVMSVTKTVHPPAGATALLAATNVEIQTLGWWLLPLVLLASMLMLASALLLNNAAGRQYPKYWWTPVDLHALREERKRQRGPSPDELDVEKTTTSSSSTNDLDAVHPAPAEPTTRDQEIHRADSPSSPLAKVYSAGSRRPHPSVGYSTFSGHDPRRRSSIDTRDGRRGFSDDESRIVVTTDMIMVPEWFDLNEWEDQVLRIIMEKLRQGES